MSDLKKPGQRAYEAYYRAIGGWATGRHWEMVSPDEQRAWCEVYASLVPAEPANQESFELSRKLEAAERELGKLRDAAKRLVYKTPLHRGLPDTADLSAADLDELHNLLTEAPPDQAPPAKPLTADDVKAIARAVVAEVAERAAVMDDSDKYPLSLLSEVAKGTGRSTMTEIDPVVLVRCVGDGQLRYMPRSLMRDGDVRQAEAAKEESLG